MANENSFYESSEEQSLSSDDEHYTVSDILGALRDYSNTSNQKLIIKNDFNEQKVSKVVENEANDAINIEYFEFVVYDENGILKNVNDLCDCVVNNNSYTNVEENNEFLNSNSINSNNSTLTLNNDIIENINSIAVIEIRVSSNNVLIYNCDNNGKNINNTIQMLQEKESNTLLNVKEPKQRKKLDIPSKWKTNKAKINRMKGDAYVGYRRENPKSSTKIIQDVMRELRKMGNTCDFPVCIR